MLRQSRGGGLPALVSAAAGARLMQPAGLSDATDGAWVETAPVLGVWRGHSAIYDPVRDRMVVFGGYDHLNGGQSNDVWVLSLADTPTWTQLTPTGTPPSARWDHSAIYDPVRDRMVVFGGCDHVNEVWVLSLADTPTWTQLTPAGTPPSARYGHSAIYDPVRDRMVVFGGFDDSYNYRNDVWALSLSETPTWIQLTPAGTPPSARYYHSAIYDPGRNRMVVFGGGSWWDGSDHFLNDVWALSLAETPAWTVLTPTGTLPYARGQHSVIYDPVRDRMVVFGGDAVFAYLNDVWGLSLSGTPAWTQLLPPSGAPPSWRADQSAIYDPVRDRLVMFGGFEFPTYNQCADVWALSLAGTPAWTQLVPSNKWPSARKEHTAIYDPLRDRMVVFGGQDASPARLNDVWALSLAETPARTWTQLTPTGTPPSARCGHSAIYDPLRDRMVVFGGQNASSTYLNDVWALSLTEAPAWTQLTPTGTPPDVRAEHSAIYDPVRDRIVMFGGVSSSYLDDVWELSLADTPQWTELAAGRPGPIGSHSAIYDPVRDRMVVFGGQGGIYSALWVLSLAGPPLWTELAPQSPGPWTRTEHSAIYDPVRDRMVVFGGTFGPKYNDVWALSLEQTPAWTQLTPTGTPPSAREEHSAIYDPVRNRMVAFGGSDALNDVWALEWGTPTGVGDRETPPLVSDLHFPVPNPSHGTTTVSYSIAKAGRVQLGVYDVRGRLVRRLVEGERRAGVEAVVWDGTSDSGTRLGTGVYFVRLVGPGIQATRQAVLLK
jgi:hypothetical protein